MADALAQYNEEDARQGIESNLNMGAPYGAHLHVSELACNRSWRCRACPPLALQNGSNPFLTQSGRRVTCTAKISRLRHLMHLFIRAGTQESSQHAHHLQAPDLDLLQIWRVTSRPAHSMAFIVDALHDCVSYHLIVPFRIRFCTKQLDALSVPGRLLFLQVHKVRSPPFTGCPLLHRRARGGRQLR